VSAETNKHATVEEQLELVLSVGPCQGYVASTNRKVSRHCQRGCYTRAMTARVQLKEKKTLVVSLKRLGARMN
jgi:hypothetical protein